MGKGAVKMGLISEAHLQLQQEAHQDAGYGTSSEKNRKYVKDAIRIYKTNDVLDYGCGKKPMKEASQKYDPAVLSFQSLPRPAEIVYCGDVFEHIELDCLDNVLSHLKSLILKCGIFVISTKPSKRILKDGSNAHRIIAGWKWWYRQLRNYWSEIKYHEGKNESSVFLVKVTS